MRQPISNAEASGRYTIWVPRTLLLVDDETTGQVIAAFRKISRAWQ